MPAVDVEPLGEAAETEVEEVWMLALLFRLEPKPRLLKRELMTSTLKEGVERDKREREVVDVG